jgi:hypothetical protein
MSVELFSILSAGANAVIGLKVLDTVDRISTKGLKNAGIKSKPKTRRKSLKNKRG